MGYLSFFYPRYIYHQILSVVTQSQLTRIFEQRKGYDLRRMIAGSERLIRSLSSAMDSDPCFLLSAVRVLPMPSSAREDISKAISKECSKVKKIVICYFHFKLHSFPFIG